MRQVVKEGPAKGLIVRPKATIRSQLFFTIKTIDLAYNEKETAPLSWKIGASLNRLKVLWDTDSMVRF